jgi:hypothetical protein
MIIFSDPPSSGDKPHHQLTETALASQIGGPSYTYRGARIDCMKGGRVYRLTLDGHSLTDMPFGVTSTITPLVDLWLEEGRLPDYMRASPKAGR